MLIRCSDSCKFQEDGLCGLKNIYSSAEAVNLSSNLHEISETGCIYYKPKPVKKQPDSTTSTIKQANQEHQRYF